MNTVVSPPFGMQSKLAESPPNRLNCPDHTMATEWLTVAQQRLEELRSGQVQAIPGEEVFARIRHRYAA